MTMFHVAVTLTDRLTDWLDTSLACVEAASDADAIEQVERDAIRYAGIELAGDCQPHDLIAFSQVTLRGSDYN